MIEVSILELIALGFSCFSLGINVFGIIHWITEDRSDTE